MPSLKNGSRLGDYAIIRLIARGGMGEVYEAHEITLDRRVALKVISLENSGDHDFGDLIRRFMQEARTLAKVNHPNIVTVHAIHNSPENQYIAMEYVEGVSLKEFLDEYTMPIEIALFLFEQMLSGVKRLHEHNIVHRDLKPSNVLIRVDGQIKILDFGIAKSFDAHVNTNPGVAVGTPPYMAPEMREFKGATSKSDFWSLGAIFFECLTGKLLVMFLEGNEFKFSKSDLKQIPEEMRAIIGGMSAPAAEDRYRSATEIVDDLQRFRESLGAPSAAALATFRDQLKHLVESKRPKGELATPLPAMPVFDIDYSSGADRMESSIRRLDHIPGLAKARTAVPESRSSKRRRRTRQGWALAASAILLAGGFWYHLKTKTLPVSVHAHAPPTVVEPVAPPPSKVAARPPSAKVQLREPSDRQQVWVEPAQNPTLSWSRVLAANEYDIQIALDPDFKKILVNEPVNGNSFIPAKILPEGVYHWRLTPASPGGEVLKPHNFTLSRLEPVLLVKPLAGQTIESAKADGITTDFEWVCRLGARLYNVQVASDPDFKKVATSKIVSECRWAGVKLAPGSYYWRVRLEIGQGYREIWSSMRQLTIVGPAAKPERLIELAAPQIKNPKQVHVLSLVSGRRSPASAEKTIEFLWRPVPGAHHYNLQVATNREFTELLDEQKVTSFKSKWKATQPGTYYWRVRAANAGNQQGRPSSAGVMTVLVPPPMLKANFKFVLPATPKEDSKPSLEWRPAPLAEQYLVQFSAKRDLASVKERLIDQPSFEVSVPPGHYFVRVASANADGVAISPYSNVAAVTVQQETLLAAPVPASPASGAMAPSRNGRISIEFSWSEIAQADSYSLEISSDSNFTNIIERANTGDARTLLEQVELQGRVYWRVKSNGGGKSSQWSETSYFDVR